MKTLAILVWVFSLIFLVLHWFLLFLRAFLRQPTLLPFPRSPRTLPGQWRPLLPTPTRPQASCGASHSSPSLSLSLSGLLWASRASRSLMSFTRQGGGPEQVSRAAQSSLLLLIIRTKMRLPWKPASSLLLFLRVRKRNSYCGASLEASPGPLLPLSPSSSRK